MSVTLVTGEAMQETHIVERLEHAGRCLLSLPDIGYSPRMKTKRYDVVRKLFHDVGDDKPRLRASPPSSRDIALMEEALDWINLIPDTMLVLRKIVAARMLVHPLNDRHLYSWNRIAEAIHSDHKGVQRLHAKAIKIIFLHIAKTPNETV